ncbi:uncharacterized protein LOC107304454 [Oryza brachyantha]|uniref:uncharacterized protein LOC107304454 n=1 Tax=Oryza brachyantha TaxID=4533 RepID=UPI001AD9FEA0|nr:uncharacterized protein LOC107304454 [Oryza brachyantha]
MAGRQQQQPRLRVIFTLVVACIVLATTATVSDARLLKRMERDGDASSSSSSAVVESPAVDLQTIVGSTEGDVDDGAGAVGLRWLKSIRVDRLGGIKDSGPSPGAGH